MLSTIDPAVAVEDRPPLRLDANRAQLVVLGGGEVLRAREDLHRPEPEEQGSEDDQRDDAEHADPEGETRRQAVRLLRLRIRREEPVRRGAPLTVRADRA